MDALCPYGPSKNNASLFSGKSTWMVTLIRNAQRLIDNEFDYIVWFYGEENHLVNELQNELSGKLMAVHGFPERLDDYIDKNRKGFHIFDDMMIELSSSKQMIELVAYKCQHSNLSWAVLLQSLFYNGKERLNLYRCAHYLCLFDNALDRSQIYSLAHKVMPGNQKTFLNIFERATNKPNGYLLIDGRQSTPTDARFRTDIFNTVQTVLIPKK